MQFSEAHPDVRVWKISKLAKYYSEKPEIDNFCFIERIIMHAAKRMQMRYLAIGNFRKFTNFKTETLFGGFR